MFARNISDPYARESIQVKKSSTENYAADLPKTATELDTLITQEKIDNLPKIVFLAGVFLLIFSAYNPVQNMVSVLFKQLGEDYLGIFAMIVVNQCYGIGSLISPIVAPRLSYRTVFASCAAAFVIFIFIGQLISSCAVASSSLLCHTSMIYSLMMGASILAGFGMAFIWFTCSVYIQASANESNKGKMFGIFGAIHQSSNITGALLSLVLLKFFGVKGFFMSQALLGCCAAALFTMVKNPQEHLLPQTSEKPKPVDMQRLLHFMKKDKMKGYFPLFMLSGYSFSFFVNNLSKMSNNTVQHLPQEEANVKIGYVLLVFGIAELGASLVCGQIFDRSKRLALKVSIGFAFLVAIINFIGFTWNSYFMFFPVAICFGFLDSGTQVVIGALLASRFNEKYEQFAIFRFVQAMFQSFYFLLFLVLENTAPQIMFLLYLIIAWYAWKHRNNY